MDDKAATCSFTESPVTSVWINDCIIEDNPENPPAVRSAGKLGTSALPFC